MTGQILHGDCREQLATLPDASIDAIVTDPPYELGFMGKRWDATGIAYDPVVWSECLRVLKPGGHLLAFGGTRTYHRMTVAIEDAGFEIRDSLHWLYGSGFPKSLDVSKAIDKAAGAERTVKLSPKAGHENFVGRDNMKALREGTMSGDGGFARPWMSDPERVEASHWDFAPVTDAAQRWNGWGTALKPAHEPIVLARKPLVGTVAANVLEYGTGALNIDATRVGTTVETWPTSRSRPADGINLYTRKMQGDDVAETVPAGNAPAGRWPSNLVLTHSAECATECVPECPVAILNGQSGIQRDGVTVNRNRSAETSSWYHSTKRPDVDTTFGGSGGASRFFTTTTWGPEIDVQCFYVPKPSRRERNAGLDDTNTHPTVKPVALIRHLVRLVTPPSGTVLDPFLGSGTTAVAATLEGFDWIGCELTADYLPIIEARVAWAETQTPDPIQPELFT
jgi:DNA modification methylase